MTALKPSAETANVSAVTCRVALSPAPSCLAAQHRCRTRIGISTFKEASLPHGRCFIEGGFNFGDQILLLFAKLYFLLWKCCLNKANEDAAGIFKICWHVSACVAATLFGAVGGSAVTTPAPLKGSPGSDAGGTRQGRGSQWH